MSTLQGKIISNSYKELLKIAEVSANQGVSASLVRVQTGDGTNTALQVATGQVYVGGTFGTGNDVSVSGDLLVTGKVCASTYYGDGSNLSNITASIGGNISVSNAIVGGTLDVAGNTSLGGTVTITGAVMVSGGSIDVKNTGTQSNIKLYCESANAHYAALQAPPHSSFSGNLTITLPVSSATLVGTSTTDTLTNKTFGDAVTFDDDISVSGNVNIGGTVTITGANVQAANAKVCASAFYGDGSNLTGITASIGGNISVSNAIVGGTLQVSGTTTLVGTATFKDATSINSTLDVNGNTSIGGTLITTGAGTFASTVTVSGDATFKTNASISGGLNIGGTVTIAGANVQATNAKVCASAYYGDGSNLTGVPTSVGGNVSVTNLIVGGTLSVSGASHLKDTVSVNGAATFGSTATVSGAAGFLGTVRVSGNTTIGGTLDVAGNVSLGGNVTVKGDVHVSSKVCASAFYGDGSNITNIPMSIAGNISVGNVVVGGTLSVSGATHLKSTVSVGGAATFNSTVTVASNVSIGGTVSIGGGIIDLKNGGSQSELRMYCESGNAHYAALKAPAHADFSGNIDLLMPASADTLAGIAATQTLSNKTFSDATKFEATVTVSGAVSIGGAVSVGGAVNLLSTATITGNSGFLGTVRVSGDTSLEGQLQLTKSAAAVVCATAINGITSVSLNFGNAQNFSTTVTAAHTLAKPTGCRTGQTGSIFLTQSGGSGTMAYNADFKFIGGTDPTLSTDNGAVDRLDYIVVSASSDGVGGDIQMVITQAYA